MPVFSCFNGDYSHLKWFSRAFNLKMIRSFLGIYINKYTKTSTNKMSINTKFSPDRKLSNTPAHFENDICRKYSWTEKNMSQKKISQ